MFLNEWEETKFIGMVANFSNNSFDARMFCMDECPKGWNEKYYLENKADGRIVLDKFKQECCGEENIIFASYTEVNGNGTAFVLFRKDNKLYEVNGSHCSCHGLEGQWEPEEANIEAIQHRLENGNLGTCCGYDVFTDKLKEVLTKY